MSNNMFVKRIKSIYIIIFCLTFISWKGQNTNSSNLPYINVLKRTLKPSEVIKYNRNIKKRGHLTSDEWRDLIDSYWGNGESSEEKLRIFDKAFDIIDHQYAAFQNLNLNVDSLRSVYRPEIEAGVSRGRFAAIMNYFSLALNEAHTILADIPVNYGTQLGPGVPLFVIGPWSDNSRFGASLTVLPDSTAIVYRALPNQKLSLIPGDIVLGYDGIPWKREYKKLLEAQLPIVPHVVWGSTKESLIHCILASVGLNWHLFDTIDIIKAETGDTVHLPTSLMQGQTGQIWGNEQLKIDGVDFPNVFANEFVSHGIVTGTDIGYIYVFSWSSNPEYNISQNFRAAVYDLMFNHETSGMIIDMRNNGGGWMPVAHAGYSLLFKTQIPTVAFDARSNNIDHFSMEPLSGYDQSVFTIPGDRSTFYNKPIAVLTGPGAVSNADFESYRLRLHPKARLFGKSSCGAFAAPVTRDLGNKDWFFYLTYGNGYPVNKLHKYLTHTNLKVDEKVWLTKEGILKGEDDVVNAAIAWIGSTTSINEDSSSIPQTFTLGQNFPNPFNPSTKIKYTISKQSKVELKIFNILGKQVATLVNRVQLPGNYVVEFKTRNLPSGVYVYYLKANNRLFTRKMVLLK